MVKTSSKIADKRPTNRPKKATEDSTKAASSTKASRSKSDSGGAESFPIVGIGASAGGLEAVEQLVNHLSDDTGIAFIVIQHLSPDRESILAELIAKKARIPVVEVTDGMKVEKNHLYVIPPGKDMAILNTRLSLLARSSKGKPHLPIDYFLHSLAEDSKGKAIGIILSGTASDGTRGIADIKAAGGITFAQEPESAKYDGMPRSAIAAGNVDFILTPDKIAEELNKISLHPYLHLESRDTGEILSGDDLHKIFILLRSVTHVDFSHYKQTTIKRRIARRMALHRIEKLSQYVMYLRENAVEIETLYQDLLIQVTSFFRDPKVYEKLRTTIFPQLIQEQPQQSPIRIWVIGCSSGEEAYSVAICLSESLASAGKSRAVQIFGTDLSEKAIEKARAGIYPATITENVSQERLERFFTKKDSGYQINKNIRELCIFARQDVINDPPFSKMDMVSCRNVMIYMERELQKKVVPKFHYALKPNGLLLLGNSETVGGYGDLFKLVDKKYNVYSKKSIAGLPKSLFALAGQMDEKFVMKSKEEKHKPFDLNLEVERLILTQFAPSSVVVNSNYEIIQSRGNTGHFLELPEGAASLNLFRMARSGLTLELRAAFQEAKVSKAPVRKTGIRLKYDKTQIIADLDVVPILPGPESKEFYYLVIFNETMPGSTQYEDVKSEHAVPHAASCSAEGRRIKELEKALETSRHSMQSIIQEQENTNEELRSVTEEVQSSNEELQSTNEELETAKEELQSTNEELMTLNDELRNRNTELKDINNDWINLLASAQTPILMVDNELRIRRFTATAETVLGLIPSDAGRPLSDLKTKLMLTNPEGIVREVVQTLASKELEVQDTSGHWWRLSIRPYKTIENRIDGAVIAVVDIDMMKHLVEEAAEARRYAEAIVETIREPLLVLDGEFRVKTANAAFHREFQINPKETIGQFVYQLANGQWDIPQLRELLQHVLPSNQRFEDFKMDVRFDKVGPKKMVLNARRIANHDQSPEMILVAIEVRNQADKIP